MFLLHRRFSRRCGTECHDLHMTNVMSSCSGCSNEGFSAVIERGDEVISAAEAVTRSGGSVLKAPVSIVIGAPQKGNSPSSGGGHAKRGLRPQGAPAPQRGHSPASVSAKPFLSKSPSIPGEDE